MLTSCFRTSAVDLESCVQWPEGEMRKGGAVVQQANFSSCLWNVVTADCMMACCCEVRGSSAFKADLKSV